MANRWTLALGLGLLAGAAAAEDAPALKSEQDKQSYAVGVNLGNQLRKQSSDLDPALVSRGLRDALSGGRTLLSEEELAAAMAAAKDALRSRQAAAQAEMVAKNEKLGKAFLAENEGKEGVVTLESGLQYKVLKAGDGKKPSAGDTVVCNYRGTTLDGPEFANTYKSRRPATFQVSGAIKGWSEALQLMPVGSKWQLFVPAALAYAKDAGGADTGPGGTLIFELELISIKEAPGGRPTASKHADPARADSVGNPRQAVLSGVPAAGTLSGLHLSFKLDSRLSGPTYGGEKWVSPPTHTALGEGSSVTVEAKVAGVDRKGASVQVSPTWVPSDPEMVTVTPGQGAQVRITVKRPGTSRVLVSSRDLSRELSVRAENRNDLLQAEIAPGPLQTKPGSDSPPVGEKR